MLESTNIEKKIYEYQLKLNCKQRIFNILQIIWKLTMVSCSQNFLTKALLTMLLVTTMALTLSGWMVSFSYKPSFIIQSLNFLSGLFCSSNVFLMLMIVNIDLNLRNDISSLVFLISMASLVWVFPILLWFSSCHPTLLIIHVACCSCCTLSVLSTLLYHALGHVRHDGAGGGGGGQNLLLVNTFPDCAGDRVKLLPLGVV